MSTTIKSTSDFEFGPAQHAYLTVVEFSTKIQRDDNYVRLDLIEMMHAGSFFFFTIFYHFDAGISEDLTLSYANNTSLL